jgi:hypothetical protein
VKRRHDRTGFATLTAVAIIGIVAVCFAAMAAMFATDLKRNARLTEEAQLRQLLIAGESVSRAGTVEKKTVVKLPEELTADGMTLSIEPVEKAGNEQRFRITATASNARSVSETLAYTRDGDHLTLRSAELD